MAQDYTSWLANKQEIELTVEGQDGGNRLYICSGEMRQRLQTTGGFTTISFLVGPQLGLREFVRATCIVGIAGIGLASSTSTNTIISTDADWDDESQQVQVNVEFQTGGQSFLTGLNYHVIILAEKP